jgi:hypothetical protein
MKFLVVLACVIAAALAAPAGPSSADVQIKSSNFENIGIDGYKFEYVWIT